MRVAATGARGDGDRVAMERARAAGWRQLPFSGIKPQDVAEHLEVVEASPDEAVLLAITRTSRTADGVALEFSSDLVRADRTCGHVPRQGRGSQMTPA